MKTTTIHVDEKLHKQLKVLCTMQDRNLKDVYAEILQEGIQRYIKNNPT